MEDDGRKKPVETMKVVVNGSEKVVASCLTVGGLVGEMGLGKQAVAVEVNRVLVPRREHELVRLKEGDVVELVTLVGGG